jgi:hypothetical protein
VSGAGAFAAHSTGSWALTPNAGTSTNSTGSASVKALYATALLLPFINLCYFWARKYYELFLFFNIMP